ncbi:MAG: DNRLRE domain-containing protein, partial [Actinobacteria bacterium]|nr:DNRLRE domain-containing protein [Actinomycetota bacterium]
MPFRDTTRLRWALLVGLCAIGAVAADAASAARYTFSASADAYVQENRPHTNYGRTAFLKVGAAPVQRAYLRFNVTSLSGRVTRVTLRLRARGRRTGVVRIRTARPLGRDDDHVRERSGDHRRGSEKDSSNADPLVVRGRDVPCPSGPDCHFRRDREKPIPVATRQPRIRSGVCTQARGRDGLRRPASRAPTAW